MKILRIGILLLLCAQLSGCGLYRMPTDEDLQTVPVTNNPNVTRNPGGGGMPMPGISY